ncbi:hypothetical protein ABT299_11640 [Spirillospora sp. NPDC000708]
MLARAAARLTADEARADADEARKETGRAEQARRTAEDNAAAAERRQQHTREAYADAKAAYAEVASQLTDAQQQNARLREALQTAEHDRDTPRAELAAERDAHAATTARADTTARELDDTRRRLTAAEQTRDTAAADAAAARAETDRQRARADAAVTELEVERGVRAAAEAELRRALEDARGRRGRARAARRRHRTRPRRREPRAGPRTRRRSRVTRMRTQRATTMGPAMTPLDPTTADAPADARTVAVRPDLPCADLPCSDCGEPRLLAPATGQLCCGNWRCSALAAPVPIGRALDRAVAAGATDLCPAGWPRPLHRDPRHGALAGPWVTPGARLARAQQQWLCQTCGTQAPFYAVLVVDASGSARTPAPQHDRCAALAAAVCPALRRGAADGSARPVTVTRADIDTAGYIAPELGMTERWTLAPAAAAAAGLDPTHPDEELHDDR